MAEQKTSFEKNAPGFAMSAVFIFTPVPPKLRKIKGNGSTLQIGETDEPHTHNADDGETESNFDLLDKQLP